MNDIHASILIVEDEESVRTSFVEIFAYLGYSTRSVPDGLAALIEIRREVPDILLSDLNMPAMSGFELLSVIRRRFPAIYVIAMSGMFTESQFPFGVTADAYYQKGGGVADLLRTVETRFPPSRGHCDMPEPIWIQRNGHDASGEEFVTIACPDCFRTFPQAINGTANAILDTSCVFCHSWILYGIVDPRRFEFPQRFQPASAFRPPSAPVDQLSD
jgi:CheY-like chemotaxis protein